MLNKFSLRIRLWLVVLIALFGVLTLAAVSALHVRTLMLEERKAQIRALTQGAYNILDYYYAQESSGRLSREQAQSLAKEAIRQIRFNGPDGKSDYFYIWTPEGVSVMHALKPEWEGKPMGEKIEDGNGQKIILELAKLLQQQTKTYMDTHFVKSNNDPTLYPKLLYAQKFQAWNWIVGTGVYIDEVKQAFHQALLYQGSIAAAVLLLIGSICWLVTQSVLNQLGGEPAWATKIMQQVAAGQLNADLGKTQPGSLVHALASMVQSLRNIMTDIHHNADLLVQHAKVIHIASGQLAKNTDDQADATNSMAAAIQQLTATSSHISDSTEKTEADSCTAANLSKQGKARVDQAAVAIQSIASTVACGSERIRNLYEQANRISSIANVIKDIAGQTNLLALNAAIEAARAGEQGRGFAVVADEVRKLAERTSSATIEIEQMISSIQKETGEAVASMDSALPEVKQGVDLAQAAAESLHQIEQGALRTLDHVREMAHAIREQNAASNAISERVETVAQTVQEISGTMDHTMHSAKDLEQVAAQLRELIKHFQL